ncbi:hypothetical protein KM043_005100 [Ampulex compressa]|nr:hypothetical protein KM043_005100 [Ampulex compressa]
MRDERGVIHYIELGPREAYIGVSRVVQKTTVHPVIIRVSRVFHACLKYISQYSTRPASYSFAFGNRKCFKETLLVFFPLACSRNSSRYSCPTINPDFTMKSSELLRASIDYLQLELLPEMVHDRCFCETGSREFVELDSARVEPLRSGEGTAGSCGLYEATAVVRFSGEPRSFSLLVKLLDDDADAAFQRFQNEEMFYSKMTLKYGKDDIPKCYLSDLGRYGRPVLVLEDLRARGYARLNEKLGRDHLELCAKVLGRFHGRGLRLRFEEFPVFREYYMKFLETSFDDESLKRYEPRSTRIFQILNALPDSRLADKAREKLGECPLRTARKLASEINDMSTICHGHFSRDNVLFKYENEKPVDVRMIDWQTMRYCSPGIDLGTILLGNLPRENCLGKVQEILMLYVDAVKREYPEITYARFAEDALQKFLFACIILSFEEETTDEDLVRMLSLLESLGAFD